MATSGGSWINPNSLDQYQNHIASRDPLELIAGLREQQG
jgi:hypothetical protein